MPFRMYFCTRSRCCADTSGPSFVLSANGSPTVYFCASSAASFAASAYLDSGTSRRVCALHVCPELRKHALTVPFTAAARSASSRAIEALLPPSSSATRFTVSAASSDTRFPARVDPVNDTMSTPGCFASASPTTGP